MGVVQPVCTGGWTVWEKVKTTVRPTKVLAGFLFSPCASILNNASDKRLLGKNPFVGLSKQLLWLLLGFNNRDVSFKSAHFWNFSFNNIILHMRLLWSSPMDAVGFQHMRASSRLSFKIMFRRVWNPPGRNPFQSRSHRQPLWLCFPGERGFIGNNESPVMGRPRTELKLP